jgi:hypothetical protein
MTKTVGILVPTAKPDIEGIPLISRCHDLNGKVVGFLWNEKPNGDFLLRRIREHLLRRYKLAGTEWEQAGVKTFEESSITPTVNKLSVSADTVVIAIGD